MLFSEHADVSVRPAIDTDANDLARIQLSAWTQTLADELGEDTLSRLDTSAMEQQWLQAITAAPAREFGVFTALSGKDVVGFCAVAPGAIIALEVDPLHQREGHGSRLLSAAVDKLHRDGASEAVMWIPQAGYAKSAFFESAGFGTSGRVRHLKISDTQEIIEERWMAEI